MPSEGVPGQRFNGFGGRVGRPGRGASPWRGSPLILILLATLVPLADASLPDPVWIEGVYDDADDDDVGGSGASLDSPVQADPAPDVVASLNAIGSAPSPGIGILSAGVPETPPTRAPPFPDPRTPTLQ